MEATPPSFGVARMAIRPAVPRWVPTPRHILEGRCPQECLRALRRQAKRRCAWRTSPLHPFPPSGTRVATCLARPTADPALENCRAQERPEDRCTAGAAPDTVPIIAHSEAQSCSHSIVGSPGHGQNQQVAQFMKVGTETAVEKCKRETCLFFCFGVCWTREIGNPGVAKEATGYKAHQGFKICQKKAKKCHFFVTFRSLSMRGHSCGMERPVANPFPKQQRARWPRFEDCLFLRSPQTHGVTSNHICTA